jgi:hypothetical protein
MTSKNYSSLLVNVPEDSREPPAYLGLLGRLKEPVRKGVYELLAKEVCYVIIDPPPEDDVLGDDDNVSDSAVEADVVCIQSKNNTNILLTSRAVRKEARPIFLSHFRLLRIETLYAPQLELFPRSALSRIQ